jgi:hypothetical protein
MIIYRETNAGKFTYKPYNAIPKQVRTKNNGTLKRPTPLEPFIVSCYQIPYSFFYFILITK